MVGCVRIGYNLAVSTFAEIEEAIKQLPVTERWELLGMLKASLLGENLPIPEPRELPQGQIQAWVDEDEADMEALRREWAAAGRDENGKPAK